MATAINKRFRAKNGLSANSLTIQDVADPVNNTDVINKQFGFANFSALGLPNSFSCSSSSATISIVNSGSGNTLDIASGVSTFDKLGNLTLGYDSNVIASKLAVIGTTSLASRAVFACYANDASTNFPVLRLGKSRSATAGTQTLLAVDDTIGAVQWRGSDGVAFQSSADIVAIVEGTPGTSTIPTRLEIGTTAQGGNSTVTRLTIDSAGKVLATNSDGFGYGAGGGTVTQSTNKSTGVTLNKVCGAITMNNAALAGDTSAQFTLTNSLIASGDLLVVNYAGAAVPSSYNITATCSAGTAAINVRNVTTGSLSEAIIISFALIKSSTS